MTLLMQIFSPLRVVEAFSHTDKIGPPLRIRAIAPSRLAEGLERSMVLKE
jgi:hypothetical protein